MRARMILVRDSHAAARMLAFPPEPTRIGVSIAVSPYRYRTLWKRPVWHTMLDE
jgi:hypothetical protein